MRTIKIQATEPQAEFLALDKQYKAFVAGYGSGKSYWMCALALFDAMHSPDAMVMIYEPTFKLVKKILIPTMAKVANALGITYSYHKTEYIVTPNIPGCGRIGYATMDDPETIIGDEVYCAHIDELDTLPTDKAELAWTKIIGRARQWPRGLSKDHMKPSKKTGRLEPVNKVCVYTTPEGYKFVYQKFAKEKSEMTGLIQASTYSNPYLADDYIDKLLDQYDEKLLKAYLEGKFENLTSGTVYSNYNRKLHRSSEKIKPGEVLYIGCDFNVMHQAATCYVRRNGGQEWHAVSELTNMYDTPEMVRIIKEKWEGHRVVIYPDASGKARKTVNASLSDIALLQQAGFEVRARDTNPRVKDRVTAMNVALSKGKIFINDDACPTVANCLEQQAYDKNGEPDKTSGVDHQNDATTYPIAFEMPIRKPVAHIDFNYAI